MNVYMLFLLVTTVMCCLRSLEGMRKGEPELDNKEKRAVKEWQGETSRKVKRDIKMFASVGHP
jgi:hypothetical protein